MDLNLSCAMIFGPKFYGDLVYKLKKSVAPNTFSVQFIIIISNYAWWSNQSRLATFLSSLIARRWVGLPTLGA